MIDRLAAMRSKTRNQSAEPRKGFIHTLLLATALTVASATGLETQTPPFHFSGEITHVIDGDTLKVDGKISVRLAEIDAPERDQPFGSEATRALAQLTANRTARFEVVDVDRYGRYVAHVFVDDAQINHEMVRRGFAWAYTRYVRDLEVIDLEKAARRQGVGLWMLPEADRDPPWIWRRSWRKARSHSPPSEFERVCGAKTKCGEMNSCAEARFYLEECGRSRLDGDNDGTPCESLCR